MLKRISVIGPTYGSNSDPGLVLNEASSTVARAVKTVRTLRPRRRGRNESLSGRRLHVLWGCKQIIIIRISYKYLYSCSYSFYSPSYIEKIQEKEEQGHYDIGAASQRSPTCM